METQYQAYERRIDQVIEMLTKLRCETNNTPVTSDITDITFDELYQIWRKSKIDTPEIKPSTKAYYTNIYHHIQPHLGSKHISAVKALDIDQFLICKAKDLSPATVHHIYRLLNTLYRFAVDNDLTLKNTMKLTRQHRQPKTKLIPDVSYLTQDSAQKFLEALSHAPLRWQCFFSLLLHVGIRRGECCGLQWGDIDFKENIIHIQRSITYTSSSGVNISAPKTENSKRVLPVPLHVMDQLFTLWIDQNKAIRTTNSHYVFHRKDDPSMPVFPSTPTTWLARYMKSSDLPPISPHDLRHTCGTLMIQAGASIKDVQDILGHANATTTLNFYVGTSQKSLRDASDKLSEALIQSK